MYTCPLFRGFYFSISCRCSCFQSRVIISVPFPGILFLNEKWIYSKCLELKCFRPLPGDLISQYAFEDQVKDLICFRPLPGDLISQLQILAPSPMQLASFRPLPGDLISQYIQACCKAGAITVSVPFPGILFLNPVLYMPDLNWIPKPNCGAKPNPTLE